MAITLQKHFSPGTTVYVVPLPHLDARSHPRGPVLAQGETDDQSVTTIEGLSKAGRQAYPGPPTSEDYQWRGPVRCAAVGREPGGEWTTVSVMVGLTGDLYRRIHESDGPRIPEEG